MRTFLLTLITLMMLVTCTNVQAIRDEYVSQPALIEALVSQGFSSLLELMEEK